MTLWFKLRLYSSRVNIKDWLPKIIYRLINNIDRMENKMTFVVDKSKKSI